MPPPKPKTVTLTPVLPGVRLDKGSMVLHPVDCDQRIPGRHQPLLLAFGARSDIDAVDATNLGPEHRHVVLRTTNREGCSVGIPDRVGERVDEPGAIGHRPEIATWPTCPEWLDYLCRWRSLGNGSRDRNLACRPSYFRRL